MDSEFASSALLARIETLLSPSVVAVLSDGEPFQTGFFVSSDGLVCTCYHGFFTRNPNATLSIQSGERTFRSRIVDSFEGEDLTLLAIEQEGDSAIATRPLPISWDELPTADHRHGAISIGYSGVGSHGLPVKPRLFPGELTVKYDFEKQERFDVFNISIGPGNSGAPVMDLHRHRVLGYIQSSYVKTDRLLGGALTFKWLLRARPDLVDGWNSACRDFDLDLAQYYREEPFPIDLDHCHDTLLEGLASVQVHRIVGKLGDKDLFGRDRYVRRSVETDVLAFLETPSEFLMLTGTAGAGKTSLLLSVAQQPDRTRFLPVLISCDGIKVGDLLQHIFQALLPSEHFTQGRVGKLFNRRMDRKWVLIFDGLNECDGFLLSEFRELIEALRSLGATQDGGNVKVIFSTRTEFLRECFPTFYFGSAARNDEPDADLPAIFQQYDGQPYLDIGQINTPRFEDSQPELKQMFESYRETGLRPITPFEQLSEEFLKIIDRPFILQLLMRHYHGQVIPIRVPRAGLLREIVRRILERAGIESIAGIEQTEIFLHSLASLILRSGKRRCSVSELQVQPWYKEDELRILLEGTPLLDERVQGTKAGDQNVIGFGADWMFEYFLAQYLWEDWWEEGSAKNNAELLTEIHTMARPHVDQSVVQHLIVALVFFADRAVWEDPARFSFLAEAMNDYGRPSFSKGVVHQLLDFFRFSYGFDKPLSSGSLGFARLIELVWLSGNRRGPTGGERVLEYEEYLENIGEHKDARWLLDLDACRCVTARSPRLNARRKVSLALNALYAHEIEEALLHANEVNLDSLPSNLRAKDLFVVGRAYQFKREYSKAEQAFDEGRKGTSLYSYRCAHQLAFIAVIAKSDFAGAAAQLGELLLDQSYQVSQDERLESRLLHAICQFRLGQYTEAEQHLREIIKLRAGQRHSHKLGSALRALADVHLRRFERDPALDAIKKALETLNGVSYRLSLASAWDTQANILGLLIGDLEAARDSNKMSLEIAQKQKHEPSKRWFLQTRALLSGLDGDVSAVRESLDQAGASSQYEDLQRRFILLLARHCAREQIGIAFETEIEHLLAEFRNLKLAWYPAILSLMLNVASGTVPTNEPDAIVQAEGINSDGLTSSYLYARIVGAR